MSADTAETIRGYLANHFGAFVMDLRADELAGLVDRLGRMAYRFGGDEVGKRAMIDWLFYGANKANDAVVAARIPEPEEQARRWVAETERVCREWLDHGLERLRGMRESKG